MVTELPNPPVHPDLDLRDFPFMPLDVVRLRDSHLAAFANGDAFRAAVLLWCAAWHQLPASSLPDDDRMLAVYVGFGRDVKAWLKLKEEAMRGFVLCSDGRYYHTVIAEKALEAWDKRQAYAERLARARQAKTSKKTTETVSMIEPITGTITDAVIDTVTDSITDDNLVLSHPSITGLKGEGREKEGRRKGEEERKKDAAPAARDDDWESEVNLYKRGKEILQDPKAGGQIKKLLKANNGNILKARQAFELAATKQDAREYINGIIKHANNDPDRLVKYDDGPPVEKWRADLYKSLY